MTDLIPAARPVPSPEDRMRDARTDTPPTIDPAPTHPGRSFRTWMSDTDRDQLDARAATAEGERDEALDARDVLRARLDLAHQLAAERANGIDHLRAELGAAQELIAVIDDATERIDRARATYATRGQQEATTDGLGSPADRAQDEPATAARLAEHLYTYQWYSKPEFPLLHEPSAHREHHYNSDCAICRGDLSRIAAVALAYVQARP